MRDGTSFDPVRLADVATAAMAAERSGVVAGETELAPGAVASDSATAAATAAAFIRSETRRARDTAAAAC
jgi:hypothetical protein